MTEDILFAVDGAIATITPAAEVAVSNPPPLAAASWVALTSPRLPGTSSQNDGRNTTSEGGPSKRWTSAAPSAATMPPRNAPTGAP